MTVFSRVTMAVVGLTLLAMAIWAATKYGFTRSLLSTSFLAHQYCYLRQPALIWTNALSDGLIWLSYVAIAIGLGVFLKRTEHQLAFRWVFVAFGLFIVACGFTHFFEMVTIWQPLYWLSTSVKIVTALASMVTAAAFVPLVPRSAAAVRLFNEAYSNSEAERVHTLSKLLDTEERMRLAMESAGFATWERNLATRELLWDERCRAIFGVPADKKIWYEDFLSHIHPEEREATQALIESSLKERQEYSATFRIVRDDGEVRSVISRGRIFPNENGERVRLVGIIVDLTRERQAQDALIKGEKLAVAGRMAASIVHEINNPLGGAMGNIYLARMSEGVPSGVQEMLNTAERELERAAEITRSTLTFYRESPSPVEINPVELIESVLTFQQGNLRRAGVEVSRRFKYSKPICAFPGELRQVFTNLIVNATEAMQNLTGDHRLDVRVRPSRDAGSGRSGYRIVIADNGPGIPPEVRRRIFDPFFTTKGEKGTGLGLWITKQLVEKNGGSIRVRSRRFAKHGAAKTIFAIWLPLRLQGNLNS